MPERGAHHVLDGPLFPVGKLPVFTYTAEASHIDTTLRPYSWYKRFVVDGAREHALPAGYIAQIDAVPAEEDRNRSRDAAKCRIAC
jgi:hypothetical protein